jgi:hypothetical protein
MASDSALLAKKEFMLHFSGGIGGTGGESNVTGGTGGTGQGNKFGKQIAKGRPAHPQMPVAELAKYQLSPQICAFLKGQGYDTVGGLFEATDIELKEAGLKPGHINQLKSALKQLPLKKSGIRGIRRVLRSLPL